MNPRDGALRVDIIDETYIGCSPLRVAEIVKDPHNHANWWPHLTMTMTRQRWAKGAEWVVTGQIDGTLEIWLEPYWEGVILHHYLRGVAGRDAPRDVSARHVQRWKRAVTRLKDLLEEAEPRSAGRGPAGVE